MSEWSERPQVEATMLNPALLAVLLSSAAHDYEKAKEKEQRLPWPLGFLVLPLVLHRPTRVELPKNTRTHLSTWIRRHPLLRAGFPGRAAAMVPLTREGSTDTRGHPLRVAGRRARHRRRDDPW
jgi:Family of unknown function (DUF6521)